MGLIRAALAACIRFEFLGVLHRERIHSTERLLARLESFHLREAREDAERMLAV